MLLRLPRQPHAGSIESPELGTMLWESGPGRGFRVLRAYLGEQKLRGALRVDDPDRAARMLMGMFAGETVLRTTLGLKTSIESTGWITAHAAPSAVCL